MAMLAAQTREFHCPRWPGCQCPDNTFAADCPGRSIPASSGDGGPARASDQASPALRAIDPDEAVATFRRQMQSPSWPAAAAQPSASLKERGEQIFAEMRAILERSDTALWMVKRELGHRADLLDDAFAAHVDMGFVSRDLRELIKSL